MLSKARGGANVAETDSSKCDDPLVSEVYFVRLEPSTFVGSDGRAGLLFSKKPFGEPPPPLENGFGFKSPSGDLNPNTITD